jgi:hypothetical protein
VKNVVLFVVAAAVLVSGWFGIGAWRDASARQSQVAERFAAAEALAGDADRLSDARVELDRVLKLDSDHVAARRLRAEVLHALALNGDAQADLAAVMPRLEGEERARAQLLLANVLTARYRGTLSDELFRLARNAYGEAQRVPVTRVEAQLGTAMLFLEKGPNRDLEKARSLLGQLVAESPDAAEALDARELLELLTPKDPAGG